MRTIFALIITLIFCETHIKSEVTVSNSQNSVAELSVEKDRSFKSADENGAKFKLKIKNTSGSRNSFIIRASMDSTPCSNKYNSNLSNKSNNSNLFMLLETDNAKSKSNSQSNIQITLEPEQIKDFTITATITNNTKYNTWGCIKVEAISNETISDKLILSVFIPDPSQN